MDRFGDSDVAALLPQDVDAALSGRPGREPHGLVASQLRLFEEEVPRSGATVERRWQYARLPDGTTHAWIQRRKQNGRGERTSGLAWDLLETREPVTPA